MKSTVLKNESRGIPSITFMIAWLAFQSKLLPPLGAHQYQNGCYYILWAREAPGGPTEARKHQFLYSMLGPGDLNGSSQWVLLRTKETLLGSAAWEGLWDSSPPGLKPPLILPSLCPFPPPSALQSSAPPLRALHQHWRVQQVHTCDVTNSSARHYYPFDTVPTIYEVFYAGKAKALPWHLWQCFAVIFTPQFLHAWQGTSTVATLFSFMSPL